MVRRLSQGVPRPVTLGSFITQNLFRARNVYGARHDLLAAYREDPMQGVFTDLNRYLGWRLAWRMEGYITLPEAEFLQFIIRNYEIKKIIQVGFNAGHSGVAFLEADPEVTVISFDCGEHYYVKRAQRFIDRNYPGRHTLIIGDSRKTLPEFVKHEPNRYDMLLVDGGHTKDEAESDLHYLLKVAHPDTFVVMDDLVPHKHWGVGPTDVWNQAMTQGKVRHPIVWDENDRCLAVGKASV